MADIIGTSGDDVLIGTGGDDLLVANGGTDILKGKAGADTYQLHFGSVQVDDGPFYTINETRGGDSAIDTITGISSLMQYNYGSPDYAEFSRSGVAGQNLIIHTAFKPHTHLYAGVEAGKIKIVNQYDPDNPNAYVEKMVVGLVEYNLLNTNLGTVDNDIITGWDDADTIFAGAGMDYVSGGNGRDYVDGEAGADIIFGGNGRDTLYGGSEDDTVFGGAGRDKLFGGTGRDALHGGGGNDRLKGQEGADVLSGGAGNDRLFGGKDGDVLAGGVGDDWLNGGSGRDFYEIVAAEGGNDTIIDFGSIYDQDTIVMDGFASLDDLKRSATYQKIGDDLVMTYEGGAGVFGILTLQDQFLSDRNAVEHIRFETDAGNVLYHFAFLKGDDYTYSVHGGADVGGEDIVIGTSGADEMYGGLGSDILVGGGGVDTFFFHDEGDSRGGFDIILDFDLALEKLDFTEIKTLTAAGLSISDNAHGNAVISSIYGAIELDGIAAADVTNGIFEFF